VVIKTSKAMQYHLIVMVLAEYSSSYSLFASHMMLVWPCSTQQHFNHFAAHSRSPHNVQHSPSRFWLGCLACSHLCLCAHL